MSSMVIRPAKCLRGEVALPGDKSISHRAGMLAAMAHGRTRIENFASSVDCGSTVECLQALGVSIEREGTTLIVDGVGKTGFRKPPTSLDCGNSGTTMRLMAGVLAGQGFDSVLTGDDSLRKRPMKRVIEPLTAMGARLEAIDGRAPMTIHGANPLRAIEYELPVASAQIKSCILLAGLNAKEETSVLESASTRDHTERMLRWFGVAVDEMTAANDRRRIAVCGDAELTARDLTVPADISAAAFFLVAAACLEGSELLLRGVGLNPTRSAVIDVLRRLGADIRITDMREANNEPVADLRVTGGLKKPDTNLLSGDTIAGLIDELPVLAVFGTQIDGGLEARDAGELRVKESDRIAAVVENLGRMGAEVEEFEDGFRVGKSSLKSARVDSFGDHRIAMAFAVAGMLSRKSETEILGAECVDVSFPGFFGVLKDVVVYE